MNLPTFITYLPQSLLCGNSGALPTGPGSWVGGNVALQTSRRLDNCRCASRTQFEVLLYTRRAGISSKSGQGAGQGHFHFIPREHGLNEHKDSFSLLPVAILHVFPCLGAGKCMVLVLQLFHLQGPERHPQQNSFPSLLGLGSDIDQVQLALYHCLVPSKTAGKGKKWDLCSCLAKVVIHLVCAWYRFPCEG